MAYRSRRTTRTRSRRSYSSRSSGYRSGGRSYGRRPARKGRARSRASTVRIELVTSPAGANRPEMLGLMPAAAPKTKPTF